MKERFSGRKNGREGHPTLHLEIVAFDRNVIEYDGGKQLACLFHLRWVKEISTTSAKQEPHKAGNFEANPVPRVDERSLGRLDFQANVLQGLIR